MNPIKIISALYYCYRCNLAGLTSQDLITNFKKFTGLERLDVSKMKIVNDELLIVVGANCPKLSVLVIKGLLNYFAN